MTNIETSHEERPLSNRTWRTISVAIVMCAFIFLEAGENLAGAVQVFLPEANNRAIDQNSIKAVSVGGIVFVALDWICGIIKNKTNHLRKQAS